MDLGIIGIASALLVGSAIVANTAASSLQQDDKDQTSSQQFKRAKHEKLPNLATSHLPNDRKDAKQNNSFASTEPPILLQGREEHTEIVGSAPDDHGAPASFPTSPQMMANALALEKRNATQTSTNNDLPSVGPSLAVALVGALALGAQLLASQGGDTSESTAVAASRPTSDETIESTASSSGNDVCEPCSNANVAAAPLALDSCAQAHDRLVVSCGEILRDEAAQCSAELHVCPEDPQNGCSSCHQTCHASCDSFLCSYTPCEYCLTYGVVTHACSHLCMQVQITTGCHTCHRLRCWSTSAFCCKRHRHVCAEDARLGCSACDKVCHQSSADPLCQFYGQGRGSLNWIVSEQDSQDTRMFQQELQGRLQHRTEFHWERIGRDGNGNRVVEIDGFYFSLGQASGENCNCFIHSLRQVLNVDVSVLAIRQDLMQEFPTRCGPLCSASGPPDCSRGCLKVYADSYLCTDHWQSVLRLLGVHSVSGPVVFDSSLFCIRVIDLTWSDNGVVLGDPTAPQLLTLALENGNHFIPAFRLDTNAPHSDWSSW